MILDIDAQKSIFAVITAVVLIIYYVQRRYNYWNRRCVPQVAGISKDLIFRRREHPESLLDKIYHQFSKNPFVGFYQGGKPILMVRDPKLIQLVLIKDFAHFMGFPSTEDIKVDPLLAHVTTGGEKWAKVRAAKTQAFSSGKMKAMFFHLEECVRMFDRHLQRVLEKIEAVEVHNLFSRFGIDVVGACVLGLNCNAIEDDDSKFRQIGRKVHINPFKVIAKRALSTVHPKLSYWLKIKLIDEEVDDFFISITKDAIQNRKESEQKRNDIIQIFANIQEEEQQLLKDRSDSQEPVFTVNVMAGTLFNFFAAGFKAPSSALSFCLYELALNPDIMETLYQEIVRVKTAHGGIIDYNTLMEMHYMDNVISESLRLHNPISALFRTCVKSYKVPDSSLVIEKGTDILIPVSSLHLDQKYFPDPKKFNPDRFDEKNKSKIIPGTYLPFGDGQKKCVGLRFAKMEIKAALALIIEKYTIHPTEKTEIPIILDPRPMGRTALNGIHLKFQRRQEKNMNGKCMFTENQRK